MPKYLWSGSYTAAGTKGLLAEGGSGRRAAIEKLIGSIGGKVECMYFTFGEKDILCILDAPDNVSAAALGLAVGASGSVEGGVTVLLTAEEVDAATKKNPAYRPPGG